MATIDFSTHPIPPGFFFDKVQHFVYQAGDICARLDFCLELYDDHFHHGKILGMRGELTVLNRGEVLKKEPVGVNRFVSVDIARDFNHENTVEKMIDYIKHEEKLMRQELINLVIEQALHGSSHIKAIHQDAELRTRTAQAIAPATRRRL